MRAAGGTERVEGEEQVGYIEIFLQDPYMPACGADAAMAPDLPIGDRQEGQLAEEEASPQNKR
jgi:hypothetical protein